MRGAPLVVALCGIAVLAVAIRVGGQRLGADTTPDATAAVEALKTEAATAPPVASENRAAAPAPPADATHDGPDSGVPERVEPRAPLSDLSLALPPKPAAPEDWKGTVLYQPVASAAGTIEAKGYRIALSGIDAIDPKEMCTAGSVDWPCGMQARTAFRSFLRGRAVTCIVPPEPERALVAATCSVGGQDVGQWLVENGWARASAGGPYAEAGEAALKARRGVFGTPAPAGDLPRPEAPQVTPEVPQAPDLTDEPVSP